MYNEYQRLQATRDACVTLPGRREVIHGAYKDWYNRHERIIDDFDNRFAAIVKRASKDQAEYSRNYGKYQAEVLQMREESKKALLAHKEKLAQQCDEFPDYVRSPKSDIPALFPTEFKPSIDRARQYCAIAARQGTIQPFHEGVTAWAEAINVRQRASVP